MHTKKSPFLNLPGWAFILIIALALVATFHKSEGATINVEPVGTSYLLTPARTYGQDDDIVEFEFDFNVTAIGDDVFVPSRTSSFNIELNPSLAENDLRFWFASDIDSTGNETFANFEIKEGDTERFTLTLVAEALRSTEISFTLRGFGWSDIDRSNPEFYHEFPEQFETRSVQMSAIPEPSTAFLVAGIGISLLRVTRRRQTA